MWKRSFSTVTGVVVVLALAGCSVPGDLARSVGGGVTSAESVSTDDTVEAGPPAFHFESGTLEFGDFDPYEIGDALFNPCKEISAAEFAGIGIEVDGDSKEINGNNSCALTWVDDRQSALVMTGGLGTFSDVKQTPRLIGVDVSRTVPGVYTYGSSDGAEVTCYASVDSVRGQVGVGVTDRRRTLSRQERCGRAAAVLEALFSM